MPARPSARRRGWVVCCRSRRPMRRAAALRCTRRWARCRQCSTPTAAGHPAERRPADPADQQDAVQPVEPSEAGQPVLAQRPAEHTAVVRAGRRDRRLGRAHGRPARLDEQPHRVHLHHRRRQRRLAVGQRGAPVPGDQQRCDPSGHQRRRPVYGSAAVGRAMERIVMTTRGGHLLEADLSAVAARSMQAESLLRNALKPASDPLFGTAPASGNYNATNDPKLRYADPNNPGTTVANPLAQQLQIVARMIDAAGTAEIGAKRQVFFVSMGGFDTHDAQNNNHAQLMARLAHALRYFDDTLGAMGARNQVTTFTASDFGRTFTSNGDGTDHGWGAHHFVAGGAVRGGDLYGTFPVYGAKNANNNNFDSSPDQIGNGALLPTTSVDQLGATLGKWFGLSDTQLLDVFPNLRNFSGRDLGFMNPA
ncbi:DUF1501 domain-containing protein [Piscinibacter aquaticus]|uniref:DUF1501 domain-containing protein n=1 Tax=Piscinibacter aquaticus TaxID=392597 RepID=A0A5C6U3E9_9BURK|nr:DUF1501 domain-containing protein [Piscinibacter aquaticus]